MKALLATMLIVLSACKLPCSAVKVGASIKQYKSNMGQSCDLYFAGNDLAKGIHCCSDQMEVAAGHCATQGIDCTDPANTDAAEVYNIPEFDESLGSAGDNRACNVYVRGGNIIAYFTTECQK